LTGCVRVHREEAREKTPRALARHLERGAFTSGVTEVLSVDQLVAHALRRTAPPTSASDSSVRFAAHLVGSDLDGGDDAQSRPRFLP
jgi:hypothetical protein